MKNFIANDKTPLGAKYNELTKCVEFRLRSLNATKVLLCIFDKPQGQDPIMVLNMEKTGNDIWYTNVKNYILNSDKRPIYYGFRVFGANWEYDKKYEVGSDKGFIKKIDRYGNRFNPNKIAYDPYSQEISHLPSETNQNLNMFRTGGNYYLLDNAKYAPKSVFCKHLDKEIPKVNIRTFNKEIIGEVHLKDLTQKIDMPEAGTYLGAAKFAKSVKDLGITMIEFLPLNEFDHKQNGTNHWGYMPLGYFSLARKYAYDKKVGNLLNEFREMITEFHKNDIKVCLDMVYNHTGEAGVINGNIEDATLMSYALIDNSQYYKVFGNGYYRSNSGCGNDFNVNSKIALDLVIDSLEFWINQGVDAFRFDLAAALLENSCNCYEIYDNIESLAAQLKDKLKERNINVVDNFNQAQDGVILIAEPWTCGGKECYQLGNFPSFWAEWNDVFRDITRKSTLRPKEITPLMLKDIFEGTPSRFKEINKSINYIASHDGFTLVDLNSYKKKSEETQGGSDWEICGDYDGDEKLKENAIRKQLALLFLSYGIPMIQIGDIIGHTKDGNNNSYNCDNNINYLNWERVIDKFSFENRIMEYVRNLIKFRNDNSIFTSNGFKNSLSYCYDNGENADKNNLGYWENGLERFFGVIINSDRRIYVALNQSNENLNIQLPKNKEFSSWHVCLDTSNLSNTNLNPKDYIEK
ncbi:MAG: hypothetical protein IKL52_07915, partial [Candidatus Gastranaerophilales bacterium]|nr:hypothetical protein [Candidatus Gastranaerophilales bacterium]